MQMVSKRSADAKSSVSAAVDGYINGLMRKVGGWLTVESARAVAALADVQRHEGVTGGVGEIGIHHGRLFFILYLAMRPEERAFAVDIFEDQDLNRDGSGHGNKAIFLRHLAALNGDPGRIRVLQQDSTTVRPEEILAATGPVRFMSVDGGHSQDVTANDLALANAVLTEDGILILDDVYNERWPGVAAAAFSYIVEPGVALRPFAVTPNKIFFCKNPVMAELYRERLRAAFDRQVQGDTELFGRGCIILGQHTLVNRIKTMELVKNNAKLYRRLSQMRHMFGTG
jgi:hypothetical protein